MFRNAVALALTFIALPMPASADPPFHPPSDLRFLPGGRPPLPTPHPRLPVTYTFSCALDDNVIARAKGLHQWLIRNDGHNIAPAGLALTAYYGPSSAPAAFYASITLRRALGPGESDQFGSYVTVHDSGPASGSVCYVSVH